MIDEVPTAAPATWSWHDATAGLMAVYLLVAAILAARWLLGQWALNRLLRQAGPVGARESHGYSRQWRPARSGHCRGCG